MWRQILTRQGKIKAKQGSFNDGTMPPLVPAHKQGRRDIRSEFLKNIFFPKVFDTLFSSQDKRGITPDFLRIFQRFRLVKFTEKFKTRVKILKIEKIVAFDKYLHELFFAFYFHLSKNLFLTLNNNEVADLNHFSTKCGCF